VQKLVDDEVDFLGRDFEHGAGGVVDVDSGEKGGEYPWLTLSELN